MVVFIYFITFSSQNPCKIGIRQTTQATCMASVYPVSSWQYESCTKSNSPVSAGDILKRKIIRTVPGTCIFEHNTLRVKSLACDNGKTVV